MCLCPPHTGNFQTPHTVWGCVVQRRRTSRLTTDVVHEKHLMARRQSKTEEKLLKQCEIRKFRTHKSVSDSPLNGHSIFFFSSFHDYV